MTEANTKSDSEIKMEILCTQMHNMKKQRAQMKHTEISVRLGLEDVEPLIARLEKKVAELARSGINRFVVKEPEIETPAQQQNIKKVN